jgi:hypothetical protein
LRKGGEGGKDGGGGKAGDALAAVDHVAPSLAVRRIREILNRNRGEEKPEILAASAAKRISAASAAA